MNAVHRYEVPVDDQWHPHNLSGPVLHVDCRRHDVVEFWSLSTRQPPVTRHFRVFGTGHDVAEMAWHCGTALTPPYGCISAAYADRLVWHLFAIANPEESRDGQG